MSCLSTRVTHGSASSSTPPSPACTRMRSEGNARAGANGRRGVGRSVPAYRPARRGRSYEGDHPRQLAIGKGRRPRSCLRAATGSSCREAPGRLRQKVQAITDAHGASSPRRRLRGLPHELPGVDTPSEIVSYQKRFQRKRRPADSAATRRRKTSEMVGDGNGPIAALVHSLAERSG